MTIDFIFQNFNLQRPFSVLHYQTYCFVQNLKTVSRSILSYFSMVISKNIKYCMCIYKYKEFLPSKNPTKFMGSMWETLALLNIEVTSILLFSCLHSLPLFWCAMIKKFKSCLKLYEVKHIISWKYEVQYEKLDFM